MWSGAIKSNRYLCMRTLTHTTQNNSSQPYRCCGSTQVLQASALPTNFSDPRMYLFLFAECVHRFTELTNDKYVCVHGLHTEAYTLRGQLVTIYGLHNNTPKGLVIVL